MKKKVLDFFEAKISAKRDKYFFMSLPSLIKIGN